MKYIYHHLGLGDHIICNGMVRHYKEIYGKVTVFCKPHNYENVKYMYRDDEDITVLPVGEDWDVNVYIFENKISKDVIKIGFDKIIENATEVHIMESSIKCLVNSYIFEKPSFYYHQYIRGYDESLNSQGKNKFITIY